MISLLVTLLVLWLIYKYIPHGDTIVTVIAVIWVLRWLGLLPVIIL